MTFRWYGDGNDDITPEMIRQIPGVSGLVWALHDKQPGEIWTVEEIEKVRARIEGAGFHMDVVESVNVHDDIKELAVQSLLHGGFGKVNHLVYLGSSV